MGHLQRVHRWPPELASRATDIGAGWWSAGASEIPVHCRTTWRAQDSTEAVEWVWGLLQTWTSAAMHVHLWRHGEHHVWLRRQDVERCECTVIHSPGHWPVDSRSATEPDLCTMPQ